MCRHGPLGPSNALYTIMLISAFPGTCSLGGEAQQVREQTAQAFQRYATLSAATHRLEEDADEQHAKQVGSHLLLGIFKPAPCSATGAEARSRSGLAESNRSVSQLHTIAILALHLI